LRFGAVKPYILDLPRFRFSPSKRLFCVSLHLLFAKNAMSASGRYQRLI
jgi:hypothetical protein